MRRGAIFSRLRSPRGRCDCARQGFRASNLCFVPRASGWWERYPAGNKGCRRWPDARQCARPWCLLPILLHVRCVVSLVFLSAFSQSVRLQKQYGAVNRKDPQARNELKCDAGTSMSDMGQTTKWLGKAIRGLRTFAYGNTGERPKVGLALGGGFARGVAHVGVLRVLEEHEIPIDFIAGTSVGALIAAAYASGATLDHMAQQAAITRFRDFGRWTLSRMGMASNEPLQDFLHRLTPAKYFKQMRIPLAIVATDLLKGTSIHFIEGEIGPALRASCAYPGLFLPVEHQDHYLVDGFLTEQVPAPAVRQMGAELVIGIHLEPGLLESKPRNTIEVISRSFSIIQSVANQPWRGVTDVLIEPDVHHVLWDEFVKTPQLIAAGADACYAALPKIKHLLRYGADQLLRTRTA